MDCNLPSSLVQGILKVKTLEWVAMPLCLGSSDPAELNLRLMSLLYWRGGKVVRLDRTEGNQHACMQAILGVHKE